MPTSDEDPTFYEMFLGQSEDSRADRFVWNPGDLQPVSRDDEEEVDPWELYWDQNQQT